ncbi:hypothetical protein HN011_010991 [Eciton burchellii]|nr:hypothetical protein HN011_010991 [Eciton burchellii]
MFPKIWQTVDRGTLKTETQRPSWETSGRGFPARQTTTSTTNLDRERFKRLKNASQEHRNSETEERME